MEMKKYFVDYLNSIGVTTVLKEKINEYYEFYYFICPEETKEIFINDNIKNDGERTYGRTCFFSKSFYMQAGIFQKKDNFYITPLKNQIINLSIEKKCYDFKKATEDSRLAVFISFPEEEKYLSATKNNCDHLRNIIIEYFIPNLQDRQKTLPILEKPAKLKKYIIEYISELEDIKSFFRSTKAFRTRADTIVSVDIDKGKKEPQEKT